MRSVTGLLSRYSVRRPVREVSGARLLMLFPLRFSETSPPRLVSFEISYSELPASERLSSAYSCSTSSSAASVIPILSSTRLVVVSGYWRPAIVTFSASLSVCRRFSMAAIREETVGFWTFIVLSISSALV